MGILSMLFRIGADTTDFEIGAKRVQSLGDKMAKTFKRDVASAFAGVFVVDKVVDLGLKAIQTAGQLNDLSQQLGVSAKFLQEMKFAAEMGGASLSDVESGLQKIQIARQKALGGNDELVAAFESLGVSSEQLKSSRIEDIFMQIGRSFEGGANPEELVAAFTQIAGKGAGSLIPAMASGLADAAEQARNLGLVMSDDVVRSLDDANDRVEIMMKRLETGMGVVIAEFITPLMDFLDAFGAGIQGFFGAMFAEGRAGFQMENWIEQFQQSFRTARDEQQAELQAKKDAEAKRAESRSKAAGFEFQASEADLKKARDLQRSVNTVFMGNQGDSLARIGGFTGFQTTQQQVINTLKIQVDKLDRIVNNTDQTARSLKGE
jgi:hypothetical protein